MIKNIAWKNIAGITTDPSYRNKCLIGKIDVHERGDIFIEEFKLVKTKEV